MANKPFNINSNTEFFNGIQHMNAAIYGIYGFLNLDYIWINL